MSTAQMTHKKGTILFSVINILYYANMSLIYSFASAYLLDYGLSNSQIGFLLGISTVFTVLMQLGVAEFLSRTGISLTKAVAFFFAVLALAAAALLLLPLQGLPFFIIAAFVFTIQNGMIPSVNSLYRGYKSEGVSIDFALCRGIGSVSRSASIFGIGLLLQKLPIHYLPGLYLGSSVLLVIFVLLFRAPNIRPEKEEHKKVRLIKEYPHFALFLFGLSLICVAHGFSETYLLQIMQGIGGNVGNMSLALGICTLTEFPAMFAYQRLFKKFGNRRMMFLVGWSWVLKSFLILFAPSVPVIYVAEILQMTSYALYVPTTQKHIAHAIPTSQFLRGQSLAESSFTLGVLFSTLFGGKMIDSLGMRPTTIIIESISVVGVLIFTFSIIWSMKVIPSMTLKERKISNEAAK